jgi:hypothetical protein
MTTKHKFTVRIDKEILTYDNYDDIPEKFDNLIAFVPNLPVGPHTQEQHDEIESWMEKFITLRKRETK